MFISNNDQNFLNQYEIQVEVNEQEKCGVIIFENHRWNVSIFIPGEKNEPKNMPLNKEQYLATANKIAVMLLKKELLQKEGAETSQYQIDKNGITNQENKNLITHEDNNQNKDTRGDYNELIDYLTRPPAQHESKTVVNVEEDEEKDDEVNLVDTRANKQPNNGENRQTSVQHILDPIIVQPPANEDDSAKKIAPSPSNGEVNHVSGHFSKIIQVTRSPLSGVFTKGGGLLGAQSTKNKLEDKELEEQRLVDEMIENERLRTQKIELEKKKEFNHQDWSKNSDPFKNTKFSGSSSAIKFSKAQQPSVLQPSSTPASSQASTASNLSVRNLPLNSTADSFLSHFQKTSNQFENP